MRKKVTYFFFFFFFFGGGGGERGGDFIDISKLCRITHKLYLNLADKTIRY